MDESIYRALHQDLLAWFESAKRDLPWRNAPRDPYHVWLAEIMLQQTQVATVIPYFLRWVERFPTIQSLAQAPIDDVLKLWEGLGYYSRARNLHRAAQQVVDLKAGRIPDTVAELLELPGIGRYTAGAIASLAFQRDAPILDGNVKRVLSRLFALDSRSGPAGNPDAPARPVSDDALWMLSAAMLPRGHAGKWNEALMDLGATLCTPRAPRCGVCPVRAHCRACALGAPEAYPAKAPRPRAPHHDVATLIIKDAAGRVLLGQRPQEGLLGGLWEFISTPYRADEPIPLALDPAWPATFSALALRRAGLGVEVCQDLPLRTVKHAFTHFKITRHIAQAACAEPGAAMPQPGPEPYQRLIWAHPDETHALALTRSDQKIRSFL